MERRALYNSLRMNWMLDSSLSVEPWQVEDYRRLEPEELFSRLQDVGISADRNLFVQLSEESDSPEDLTEHMMADQDATQQDYDQAYLVIFELWRRFLPENLCLSIFCDELDQQIFTHDQRAVENINGIQNALDNLQMAIEENIDEGVDPTEIFEVVTESCANDVENFLYDFISEQIEHHNITYATDLIEAFTECVINPEWFDLLQARVQAESDPLGAHLMIKQLCEEALEIENLEFNFALLAFLIQQGDKETFARFAEHTIALLEVEEDFQELLTLSADFFSCLDKEQKEAYLRKILEGRTKHDLSHPVDIEDKDIRGFLTILST